MEPMLSVHKLLLLCLAVKIRCACMRQKTLHNLGSGKTDVFFLTSVTVWKEKSGSYEV